MNVETFYIHVLHVVHYQLPGHTLKYMIIDNSFKMHYVTKVYSKVEHTQTKQLIID